MTKGQRAMAIAMLSPEPEDAPERGKKGGRGKKASINGQLSSIPRQRIHDARAVLAYSLELAEAVMRCVTRTQRRAGEEINGPPADSLAFRRLDNSLVLVAPQRSHAAHFVQ